MESIKAIISCCSFQDKAEEQTEGSQNPLPVPIVSSANPIEKAQLMKNVFEDVKKEAESVAAVIKHFFEETFGKVFSSCSMAQQESQEAPITVTHTEETKETSAVVEEKKPVFPEQFSDITFPFAWSDKKYLDFQKERSSKLGTLESYGETISKIKSQTLPHMESSIATVKSMDWWQGLQYQGPSLEDLKKSQGEAKTMAKNFQKECCDLADELANNYVTYPDFRDKLRSREGFPFKMFFDNQELEQGKISEAQLYHGIMQDLSRNSTTFEKTIEQKLKDWSGQSEIDPTNSSDIATQAQLILVRISVDNGPSAQSDLLVLDDDDKEHRPKTLPETISVYFEKEGDQSMMRVERQVETRDRKRYSWSETISFAGPNPVATRTAKELPDQGRF